jgi:hypothetical protein
VAVLNRTTAVPEDEIRRCVAALQTQVHCDLAPAWGVDAELKYCGPQDTPPPGWWWLELTDEPGAPEAPGYLAWRTASPTGLPVSRVFMKLVQSAGVQWTISASHALVEMLVNPRRNLAVLTEVEGKLRICTHDIADPCSAEEDGYPIGGVRVSDFVFPAWFDPEGKKGPPYDRAQRLTHPLEVGCGARVTVYEGGRGGRWRVVEGPEQEVV